MAVPYVEEEVLRLYVWEHSTELMTQLELEIRRGIHVHQKAAFNEPGRAALIIKSRWEEKSSPEAKVALREGPEVARRRICDRILRDRATTLFVNKCPACGKIAR